MTEGNRTKYTKEQIDKAIDIVREQIDICEEIYKRMLEKPVDEDDLDITDLVELTMVTTTGFDCKMYVDRKDIVKVLLDNDYPIYKVLRKSCPESIWNKIANVYGMDQVEGISYGIM